MSAYSIELAESAAVLNCSCCNSGATSLCGFIRRDHQPYSIYYALVHNNRRDPFVRLSISISECWTEENYEKRHALCVEIIPAEQEYRITVLDAVYSPQQNFPEFGEWMNREEARQSASLQQFLDVANFILQHDPAVKSYLAGDRIDDQGRKMPAFTQLASSGRN